MKWFLYYVFWGRPSFSKKKFERGTTSIYLYFATSFCYHKNLVYCDKNCEFNGFSSFRKALATEDGGKLRFVK